MALPGPSRYQKQMAARRRTSDITRLADQYQKNVQAMTADYEKAFGQYQAQTKETMAPYEQQIKTYQTDIFPQYQAQADQYMKKLQDYQDAIKGYEEYRSSFYLPVGSNAPQTFAAKGGKFYFAEDVAKGVDPAAFNQLGGLAGSEYQFVQTGSMANRWLTWSQVPMQVPNFTFKTGPDGRAETVTTYETIYIDVPSTASETLATGYLKTALPGGGFTTKAPEQFSVRSQPAKLTEKPPEAPQAPVAPEIPAFDTTEFDARRGQLESEFQRELGERRSARRRAVSRGGARPLLQGTSA